MNKLKNEKQKNLLDKLMKKSSKLSKKLNNTFEENKLKLKKCENFCKNYYMIEMDKVFKKIYKKYHVVYKLPTKEEKDFAYNNCKKIFCNKKCDGYDFYGNKEKQNKFKNEIEDGFQKSYSKDKVEMLKKRGAISA